MVENKKAIALFQTSDIGKKYTFSNADWELAKGITQLLKPAHKATKDISGASYVTGSMVIPLTKVLLGEYNDKKELYPNVTEDNFRAREAKINSWDGTN